MNKKPYLWIENSSRERLADQLAGDIALVINHAIVTKGQAIVALSGGSTPTLMFAALSQCDIDWSKTVITLVDERCVDDQHVLSNARFIKHKLLDALPETVTFIPLFYPQTSNLKDISAKILSQYCTVTNSKLGDLTPFDVVILGMGADGHTASFFPDADNIDSLVDADTREYILSCESSNTQVPRITWSLRMLIDTKMLALHINGSDKKKVFEKAARGGDAATLPIRSAIFQNKTRLNVYYAD
ncbi:6-phosphogluconolactonase [Arenicella sp.]|nr:6-phosphogluconolactonase [Arenicella sp.]